MIRIKTLFFVLAFTGPSLYGQQKTMPNADPLPFREIPDYPSEFTPETVVARMVDGLGFRYYWATEGLRPEDLNFRPSENARNAEATIDHILGLSNVILNSMRQVANTSGGEDLAGLTFAEKRKRTLENLRDASNILKSGEGTLADYPIIFERDESISEYPFWYQLNGPIADALWHVGQVVTFRRSSGNPINPKVSVFSGKVREW